MKSKRIVSDMLYSISALVLMNVVLQFIVYPILNKQMGDDSFGSLLYILGLVSIIAPSIGSSANNTRLLVRHRYESLGGDYNIYILISSLLAGGIILLSVRGTGGAPIFFMLLLTATAFRYYADVEFRLSINYRGYFKYYIALSFGYIAGLLAFQLTGNWYLTMLFGEIAAITYVCLRGIFLKNTFVLSKNTRKIYFSAGALGLSYLLYNAGINMDRLILKGLLDSTAVTQYYVVSLIGKTIALMVGPLNSVIISYITKSRLEIKRKLFIQFSIIVVMAGIVAVLGCVIVTPIFIKIFYPQLYEATSYLILGASISQVFCFLSSVVMIVILTLCSEKWQLRVQVIYVVLFLLLAIPATMKYQLWGFMVASIIANLVRFIGVVCLGIKSSK